MAKKKHDIVIGIVLDESGSMQSVAMETISSINDYFDSLRSETVEVKISLTLFSSGVGSENFRPYYISTPIADVKGLTNKTYRPKGYTPLYDAVGATITGMEVPPKTTALCVIVTDGAENSSKEYTGEKIRTLIKEKESKGWKFIYLGADQSAMEAATASGFMGMAAAQTMSYAKTNTGPTYAGLRGATQSLMVSPDMSADAIVSEIKKTNK